MRYEGFISRQARWWLCRPVVGAGALCVIFAAVWSLQDARGHRSYAVCLDSEKWLSERRHGGELLLGWGVASWRLEL